MTLDTPTPTTELDFDAEREAIPDRRGGAWRVAVSESLMPLATYVVAPLAGALVVALMSPRGEAYESAMLGFLALVSGALLMRRPARAAALLPFMRTFFLAAGPVAGVIGLAIVQTVAGLPSLEVAGYALLFVAGYLPAALRELLAWREWTPERRVRIAVIGSQRSAGSLARELESAGVRKYVVAGRIAVDEATLEEEPDGPPPLGTLSELCDAVTRHEIDLLLMTAAVPRLAVFDQVATSCLHLPVRLWELSGFYEELFGHVPVVETNTSWFQYIMHPKFRSAPPPSKRALDVTVAAIVGLLALPLLAVLALLIRRDGGPVLFRQVRIGEGGRPFTLCKLRSMRVGTATSAQWAAAHDPRITGIGRFLRRTHLDELPQLLNVLRGEMSLVGPRPEQPEFVDRLEQMVTFYTRRHLVKPGITGWAQVRCGYAGSDVGSAWKLCHDLYYLKHRSFTMDLMILGETVRTLFADAQYSVGPAGVSFIVDADRLAADALSAAGEPAHITPAVAQPSS
ncbi:MAG: exopolysaccharide biosynthesis polyprenyl glycosylphosphotransferase [Actinomycetota bacterium]|nr:exopolysaccharide biosynthesis polyprenyl glycosylphosphotransferase [Actinomycetota bacterium]